MPERITRDDVVHVARLANLALTDDEITAATQELGAVLAQAADVEALELDDVAPMTHPLPLRNVWRADEVGPTLDRAEVLAAAPATDQDRFSVPTILGEEP